MYMKVNATNQMFEMVILQFSTISQYIAVQQQVLYTGRTYGKGIWDQVFISAGICHPEVSLNEPQISHHMRQM